MTSHLRTELVLDALEMAVGQRRPRHVARHSDQGPQHTSVAFGARGKEAGVRPPAGPVGGAHDGATCESFLSTLEAELLSRRRFASPAEAACFSCVEGFHDPPRLHPALGCKPPIAFEQENTPKAMPQT